MYSHFSCKYISTTCIGSVVQQIAVDVGLEQYGDGAHIIKAMWLPGSEVCKQFTHCLLKMFLYIYTA